MNRTLRIASLALSFAFVAALSMSTASFATVGKPRPVTPGTGSDTRPKCDPNVGCGIYS